MNAEHISEILKQYVKHGWILRRVLLSEKTRADLSASLESLFGEIAVFTSEIDAIWFSRVSANGLNETWELRRLSQTPFAVVEVFDTEEDEEVREETLLEIQRQMANNKR